MLNWKSGVKDNTLIDSSFHFRASSLFRSMNYSDIHSFLGQRKSRGTFFRTADTDKTQGADVTHTENSAVRPLTAFMELDLNMLDVVLGTKGH